MKKFFIYKGSRTLNTQNGPLTLQTQEGFAIDEVLDFTIIEKTEGTPEQVIVRLKNMEDVDKWATFPKGNKAENRFVRRNENSVHGINNEEDIVRFKELFI